MTLSSKQQPDFRDVAVVGLGQMGRGIAANLDRAGRLKAAWDLSEACRQAAGLSDAVALAPPERFGAVSTVIFVVPGSAQIAEVLPAVLALPGAGRRTAVDLTTSHPAATGALAAKAVAAGWDYVDCGMTGGAAGADAGTLTLMAGGEVEALARVMPALEVIAAKVVRVGASGAGHTMKLVHNMICHTVFLATAEGCRMAERAGLDLDAAIEVINAGNARSFISEARFPRHILTGKFDGRSVVANLEKDLRMANAFAGEIGQPAAYTALTARLLAQAVAEGRAGDDFTTLYKVYDELVEKTA